MFLGEVHSKILDLVEDPKSYKEATNCAQSKLWVEAMWEELNSMRKNKVWELVYLANNRKPIGCKWIFKRKLNVAGQVENIRLGLLLKALHKGKVLTLWKHFLQLQNLLLFVLLVL